MEQRTIYALGVFDGVHRGHQALLLACSHLAQRKGCKAGVVTFASHPDALVLGKTPPLINTVLERQRLLIEEGISEIKVLPFDEAVMNMSWQDFLEDLIRHNAAGFVCGDDFRFGFRGEGTAQKLAEFCRERNLPWAIVPAQTLNGVTVSSTYIRQLLEAGEMEKAVQFLGHPHTFTGRVVEGRKIGRTIGIPTANLHLPEGLVVPKFGVYACEVIVEGKRYPAVTNIGTRPTVGGTGVTVEPWILDFDGDLYGKMICLLFYKYLRPERKFGSLEELKMQIQQDAAEVLRLLR